MGIIDMLLKRKKQTEDAMNVEDGMQETAEEKKARLAREIKTSSDTYRSK